MLGSCPNANLLAELLDGGLDNALRVRLETHFDVCDDCTRLVAELARLPPNPGGDTMSPVTLDGDDTVSPDITPRGEFTPGAALGRFTLLERLGIGGMGVVWAAYDPRLDRKIALKFVRAELASRQTLARLEREAKALARINHPNVVAVHDIGIDRGEMYIAQEFVHGSQLGAWFAERPREVAEILAVFSQAGRGLAAAHAAGIVHRDFKPRNVLVGRDGRVRVADFGIAHPDAAVATGATHSPTADPALTATGQAAGTPRYMSPEQQGGEPCDARSDQFSFCLSLVEALYGGSAIAATGTPTVRLTATAKIPARVRAALERGLHRDPNARFATMDALLDALERDRSRRWRGGPLAIAAGSLAVAAFGVGYAVEHDDRPSLCEGADLKLAAVWNPFLGAHIDQVFAVTGQADATLASRLARQALDHYGHAWVAMHTEACEAARVRGDQSEDVMDRRMACLGARLEAIRATVDVFLHADRKVVVDASRISSALPPLAECSDLTALESIVRAPGDPLQREKVDEVRSRLAHVQVAVAARQLESTLADAEAVVAAARATGYGPVIAAALRQLGVVQTGLNQRTKAFANLRAGYVAAVASGDRVEGARIAAALTEYVGVVEERREDALWWADMAHAQLQGLGEAGRDVTGTVELSYGTLLLKASRFDEAIAALDRARAIWTTTRDANDHGLLDVALMRATASHHRGQVVDALAALRALRQRAEQVLGSSHPFLASIDKESATTLDRLQRYREAITQYRTAIAIVERSSTSALERASLHRDLAFELARVRDDAEALAEYRAALALETQASGPQSAAAARIHQGLGTVFENQGNYRDALAEYEQALAMFKQTLGPDAPDTAHSYRNVGSVLQELGRRDEALVDLTNARDILIQALGRDHPEVADIRVSIATALDAKLELRQALAELEPALTVFEKAIGPDAPYTAWIRISIACLQLRVREHLDRALPAIDRGLATLEKSDDHEHLAYARFAVGRALVGLDRARAVDLVHRARGYFAVRPADPATRETLRDIDRWLAN
jgi:tetratricopeptide (TPR) repeat protein/tRNA A-37 threonylcarbamoyl transferase component Bud32